MLTNPWFDHGMGCDNGASLVDVILQDFRSFFSLNSVEFCRGCGRMITFGREVGLRLCNGAASGTLSFRVRLGWCCSVCIVLPYCDPDLAVIPEWAFPCDSILEGLVVKDSYCLASCEYGFVVGDFDSVVTRFSRGEFTVYVRSAS